jgi:bacterioferritin-associated ferredoxin
MYICLCKAITEGQLTEIIKENDFTAMADLQAFGIANNCSKCYLATQEKLIKYIHEKAKICPTKN